MQRRLGRKRREAHQLRVTRARCSRALGMSVLLETSLGEIVIDLLVDDAPIACLNFLKLCKIKYYNAHLFHFIERDLLIQAGDPSRTGRGGSSIFGLLGGAKHFQDEFKKSVKHDRAGTWAGWVHRKAACCRMSHERRRRRSRAGRR